MRLWTHCVERRLSRRGGLLLERRLREGFPKRRGKRGGDYTIRNQIIVAQVERTRRRGFPAWPNEATDKAQIIYACDIVHTALARCGVKLAAATIVDIWKARALP